MLIKTKYTFFSFWNGMLLRERASWSPFIILLHLMSEYYTYVEGVVRVLVVLARLYFRLVLPHETRFSCVQYLLKSISFGEIVVSALSLKHFFCVIKAHKDIINSHISVFLILATFCRATRFSFIKAKKKTILGVTGTTSNVDSVWKAVCQADST